MEAGIQISIARIIATNMSVALANTDNNFDFLPPDFSQFEATFALVTFIQVSDLIHINFCNQFFENGVHILSKSDIYILKLSTTMHMLIFVYAGDSIW